MRSQTETLHGVFIEVLDLGVLLEGPSGIGKSGLALELVSRGHKLIADDAPEFHRCSSTTVSGTCPAPLQDFIAVFGLGVLNIPAMFGADAVKKTSQLQLLISLVPANHFKLTEDGRLKGSLYQRSVLGVEISAIKLPVTAEHNMAIMVENAIRNHKLRVAGYNAAEEFINNQRFFLGGDR
ncbi:MAG TPA: hypothetical protein ENJ24_01135 [Gammaproteobacteria bacterium]|nr:hypothetical protein [Gammaproteobacteria bacterium]